MIESFINSAVFKVSLFDAQKQPIQTDPVLAQEYKLYTDNNNVYLYIKYVSPTHLLNIQKINTVKSVSLEFLNAEQKPTCCYSSICLGYSIELEGSRTQEGMLTWDLVLLLDLKTIETTNP